MVSIRIQVASDIDYEKLIAELYIDGEFAGFVCQETGQLEFVFPEMERSCGLAKRVALGAFMRALKEAAKSLRDEAR